jgi:hypothetical protein
VRRFREERDRVREISANGLDYRKAAEDQQCNQKPASPGVSSMPVRAVAMAMPVRMGMRRVRAVACVMVIAVGLVRVRHGAEARSGSVYSTL